MTTGHKLIWEIIAKRNGKHEVERNENKCSQYLAAVGKQIFCFTVSKWDHNFKYINFKSISIEWFLLILIPLTTSDEMSSSSHFQTATITLHCFFSPQCELNNYSAHEVKSINTLILCWVVIVADFLHGRFAFHSWCEEDGQSELNLHVTCFNIIKRISERTEVCCFAQYKKKPFKKGHKKSLRFLLLLSF